MEVDTRPLPAMVGSHRMQYRQNHDHDQHRSFEATRQSLPPPYALLQTSPSNLPVASPSQVGKPVHDVQYVLPPRQSPREFIHRVHHQPSNTPRSHPHSSVGQRANGQVYPQPPQGGQLDAMEYLQTQTSQNNSALLAPSQHMCRCEETLQHKIKSYRGEFTAHFHQQNAELGRVDKAVGRLQYEMLGIRELFEGLTREVHATRELQACAGNAVPGDPISGQDSALELMAQQIAIMTHKTNEVDTLKITIEIMKNKIQRLEDAAATALQARVAPEPPQAQSSWTAVNAGVKRTYANSTDSPQESIALPIGSPGKRPKLDLESQAQPSNSFDHMDTEARTARGRGSGGDPGSRGGRMRKSMTAQYTQAKAKKRGSKSIRNADGEMIRKDGKLDKRSLPRVRRQKEEEERRNSENSFTATPSNLQHSTSTGGTETSSPKRRERSGEDLTSSQNKHTQVMSKIFPSGVDEVSKDHDYARKLFEEDEGHTAQSHAAQHHHHNDVNAQDSRGRVSQIKRVHGECYISLNGSNVDTCRRSGRQRKPSAS